MWKGQNNGHNGGHFQTVSSKAFMVSHLVALTKSDGSSCVQNETLLRVQSHTSSFVRLNELNVSMLTVTRRYLVIYKVLDNWHVWPDDGARWKVRESYYKSSWMTSKCHRNPFHSCRKLSVVTSLKIKNLRVVLEEKSLGTMNVCTEISRKLIH